jgi:hypothetical protein
MSLLCKETSPTSAEFKLTELRTYVRKLMSKLRSVSKVKLDTHHYTVNSLI